MCVSPCLCLCVYLHLQLHECMHTSMNTHIQRIICEYVCIHSYVDTYIHSYIFACLHIYIHKCILLSNFYLLSALSIPPLPHFLTSYHTPLIYLHSLGVLILEQAQQSTESFRQKYYWITFISNYRINITMTCHLLVGWQRKGGAGR